MIKPANNECHFFTADPGNPISPELPEVPDSPYGSKRIPFQILFNFSTLLLGCP